MRLSVSCLLLLATFVAWADEPSANKPQAESTVDFFEKRIRPLLAHRCWDCHGADLAESDLRLDTREDMLEGGSRGAALVPGEPTKSLLIRAVNHADTLAMPPKEKLSQRDISDLTAWVKAGAVWPAGDAPRTASKNPTPKNDGRPMQFSDEQKNFWAFQPIGNPRPPQVNDERWIQSPIDRFIWAELNARGLKPAEVADKRTLIRRATFDLQGVPPTVDEVAEFMADNEPDAFARLIDRLLASPRYGERWGRHWLDVARYGDSNGLDENLAHANAFRYRDWVIAAFNRDLPYDQFVHEQISGDLLPPEGDPNDPTIATQQADRLTATGFLVIGAKMLAEDDGLKMQMDIVDEQVDTIGKAFMGLTLGCARCHDHKFDPVSTADYYSLAGIFKSTKTMENFSVVARWHERPLAAPVVTQQLREQQRQIAAMQEEANQLVNAANEVLITEARSRVADYVRAAVREMTLERTTRTFGADMEKKGDAVGRIFNPVGRLEKPPYGVELPEGVRVIEAEDYQRGSALKLTSGYGEGIGVILSDGNGEWIAEYDINVPAGTYQIETRYAAAGSRPTQLSLNRQVVKPDALTEVTGSWNPDTQRWHIEGRFEFKEGANVVRLYRHEPLPHIDKLLIARVATGGSPVGVAVTDLRLSLVSQWKRYFERTLNDPNTPLIEWRDLLATLKPLDQSTVGVELSALADKTGSELAQVVEAWSRLKGTEKTTGTKPATELPDARQEALRKLLFNMAEGFPFAVPKNAEEYFNAETKTALLQRREEIKQREAALPKLPEAMAVSEGTIEDLPVHLRGNHTTLAKERQPRRFPRIFNGDQTASLPADRSGRIEFARWLTDSKHPLTARVAVNRIWQGHFGEGLVRSPDNFGLLGDKPTHPALLDWLSREFVGRISNPSEPTTLGLEIRATGASWSMKSLHRAIMLSSAYQMQTTYREESFLADPDNRLWWRRNRRRLEVEAVRDSLLSVSGRLDNEMGGTLLPSQNRAYVTSTANNFPNIYISNRRSVYLPVIRSALYELFQVFDFAEPSVLNGKRDSTTLATQALFMLNSSLVAEQSRELATKLVAMTNADDDLRVRRAYALAFQREPSSSEIARAKVFVQQFADSAITAGITEEQRLAAWRSFCRTLLAANEFLFVE
ncbi:MAG: DUF1549 domain-containing protein [Planctomycetia bacterium]|nr:DUF1549 domain-containing protein [Planctomycetia bacterium]